MKDNRSSLQLRLCFSCWCCFLPHRRQVLSGEEQKCDHEAHLAEALKAFGHKNQAFRIVVSQRLV